MATAKTKLTTQKLHKVIQSKLGVKSSKYSPSQRINRTTYDVSTLFKGFYGVMSSSHIDEICEALDESGIRYNAEGKARGFVEVYKFQQTPTL